MVKTWHLEVYEHEYAVGWWRQKPCRAGCSKTHHVHSCVSQLVQNSNRKNLENRIRVLECNVIRVKYVLHSCWCAWRLQSHSVTDIIHPSTILIKWPPMLIRDKMTLRDYREINRETGNLHPQDWDWAFIGKYKLTAVLSSWLIIHSDKEYEFAHNSLNHDELRNVWSFKEREQL